jgi:LmbE family N-acetylglucosaminyl deacetylase
MPLGADADNLRSLHAVPPAPDSVVDHLAMNVERLLVQNDASLPALPEDIEVVQEWPHRIALVIGAAPHPDVLSRRQIHPITVPVDRALDVAPRLGPFIFLLLCPDALATDIDADTMRAVHRCSPTSRSLLVANPAQQSAPVLLRALRAGVSEVLDPSSDLDRVVGGGLVSAGVARERVLAIGAHPDDVEIGCGGTLLDHRRRGDRITILTMSRGAIGGDAASRTDEAAATAASIGAQLLLGSLPDTQISDGVETIRLIEAVVRAIDPTVVYVHSPNDNHQDHRAVSSATMSATRGVRRVFAYQSPSATNGFTPTQFVAIDDVMDRKVEVLNMFGSQNGRSYLEPEMVIASCRYWARHLSASARYAEPFEVVRSVGDLRQLSSAPAAAMSATSLSSLAALIPTQLMEARA